jgi:hypothetical protein
MRRTLRHASTLLVLLGTLVGIPRGAVVLCVGDDGHFAFERSGEAACETERACLDHDCACADACGTCRDAVLGDHAGAATIGSRGTPAILASLATTVAAPCGETPEVEPVAPAPAMPAPAAPPFGHFARLRN